MGRGRALPGATGRRDGGRLLLTVEFNPRPASWPVAEQIVVQVAEAGQGAPSCSLLPGTLACLTQAPCSRSSRKALDLTPIPQASLCPRLPATPEAL